MIRKQINQFIKLESFSGIILFLMLLVALILANSPLHLYYEQLQDLNVGLNIGSFKLENPLLLWVNKGLMTIFFLLLSLEIKREALDGELSKFEQMVLPIAGAAGGIIMPIVVFLLFNYGHPLFIRGWPIATTTDIAFMLGVITLLRNRVPVGMKVMLVALSIIDDIFAILLLAIYYTSSLSWWAISAASLMIILLIICNRLNVKSLVPYGILGVFLWWFLVNSGVHATLTGVVLGAIIPLKTKGNNSESPLRHLEDKLHPWVAFCILPLFVLFNGGVFLGSNTFAQMLHPLFLGVSLGLCVGKMLGVFLAAVLVIKLGYAIFPKGTSYRQLLGCASLTGIGFTMSLFFTGIAFPPDTSGNLDNLARQAVLVGSFVSCLVGVLILCIKDKK